MRHTATRTYSPLQHALLHPRRLARELALASALNLNGPGVGDFAVLDPVELLSQPHGEGARLVVAAQVEVECKS